MLLNDRYQVHDRLGEGGMGLVYRATDQRLGRQVAVKMLRPQYGNDAGFVERFEQEAQSAAGLSHPNIAAVYDTGQDGETRYIVMELLKPFSLHDLIARSHNGRLSPDDAINYGAQIAAALAHAHGRGVVHRDIKPQNILFTDDGLVKVTDFGIARALAATGGTATGTILGSPSYISPEQASGETAGPASDLYSLGVVLYEMLTGTPPYQGEQPVAIAVQHLNSRPQPPSERVPGIPRALERVVLQAMARRPEARFSSADAMRQAIESSLTASALEATGVIGDATRQAYIAAAAMEQEPEPEPYQRVVAPRTLSPAMLAGLLLLVIVGVGIGIFSAGRKPPAPEPTLPAEIQIEATKRIVVPQLVGQDVDRARVWIEEKYRLEQVTPPQLVEAERRDGRAPANEILEQTPPAGAEIDEGGVIRVVVSSGAVMVFVPDLRGMTVDRAKDLLQSEGLMLGTIDYAQSEHYVPEVVMAQEQAPDSKLREGSAVNITVSQGQPEPEPPVTRPPDPPPTPDPPEEPGAPPVSLSIGQPREVDGGLKQATVVVSVPSNSVDRAVELKWLEGGSGTAVTEVVSAGGMLKEDIRGVPGAVLGIFVDGEQKGKVEY